LNNPLAVTREYMVGDSPHRTVGERGWCSAVELNKAQLACCPSLVQLV